MSLDVKFTQKNETLINSKKRSRGDENKQVCSLLLCKISAATYPVFILPTTMLRIYLNNV